MFSLRPGPEPLTDEALIALYAPANRDHPVLRANFVESVDGAVTVDGRSKGLSGPADKKVFQLLRMLCDALLVGAGTLRNEKYRAVRLDEERRAWRRAHGLAEFPTLVVISARLAIPSDHPALADAPVRPVVVTHADTGPAAQVMFGSVADVVAVGPGEVDLRGALAGLHDRGLRQILCEGGPHLFASLAAADLVDELCLTVSPLLAGPGVGRIVAGPGISDGPRRLTLRHALLDDDALLLRYVR